MLMISSSSWLCWCGGGKGNRANLHPEDQVVLEDLWDLVVQVHRSR